MPDARKDLSSGQRDVIRRALRVAEKKGASARVKKALVEAMAVESGYRHLDYGDRDSVGVLQQRPSQGWGPAGESVETDVAQFLDRAIRTNRGFRGSAGQLAQAVQRSAFPERYDQRGGEAEQILSSLGAGGPTTTTSTSPGVDNSQLRSQILYQYLQNRGRPDALLQAAAGVRSAQDVPGTTTSAPSRGRGGTSEGKGPLLEMFYQGPGGINVKNGKRVKQGFVSGHTDHVHVASGPKTAVQLGRLAQQMGLAVRENEAFDPVDPVHSKNSYHYRNQAIDVSGDPAKMAAFARRVARMYGVGS